MTPHDTQTAAFRAEIASIGDPLRPTSVEDVQAVVRDAIERRERIRIVGRGTWLAAGRPVREARAVSLDQLTGIVSYTPGDLTLTARAGTPLAEIVAATAEHGQWLALVPWGGDAGSLGATAATATAGPTSGALGTPRDTVIGLEAVTGTGEIVRGGGRVVKNVAGFDLTRLMIGAWGTLGILTEISVRLRALPEVDTTVALPVPNATAGVADLLTRLRAAPVTPLALELLNTRLAAHLGLDDRNVLLARLAGNAEAVAAQRATHEELGAHDVASAVWDALRVIEPRDCTTLRLSSAVSRFAETWIAAERLAASAEGFAHASMLRSIARVILPHNDGQLAEPALTALRAAPTTPRIFERLPSTLWSELAPAAVTDRLSRGIRAAFDPSHTFNPGILGEAVQ